jgi:alcohol dehydrogenase class IV
MEQNMSANDIATVVNQTITQYLMESGSLQVKPQSSDRQCSGKSFTFRSPAITVTGAYCVNQLGETLLELGATHVLLVADKLVHQLGLVSGCEQSIALAGIRLTLFAEVEGEPDTAIINQGIQVLKQSKADFVVGIGGGSALDAAKAMAVMIDHQGPLADLKIGGIASRKVGLGSIPTTSGTGSEATDIAVIQDLEYGIKIPLKGPALVPDFALLDPVLMLGVPDHVTAATGIDTLTHAIEAYVSRETNPLSKAYAYHAIETVIKSLPVAVGCGDDLDMRYEMSIAAYKAGMAFSNAGLGLTHAIAHQIGAQYHIPHGVANAILLPYVMAFNALSCEKGYAELAGAMGIKIESMTRRESCNAVIQMVRSLVQDLGLPNSLSVYNINAGDFPQLAERVMLDICLIGNPRQVTEAQIVVLLNRVLVGDFPVAYC